MFCPGVLLNVLQDRDAGLWSIAQCSANVRPWSIAQVLQDRAKMCVTMSGKTQGSLKLGSCVGSDQLALGQAAEGGEGARTAACVCIRPCMHKQPLGPSHTHTRWRGAGPAVRQVRASCAGFELHQQVSGQPGRRADV